MSRVIEAVQVFKSFKKSGVEIPVLRGVSLEVKEGEMVAITGESGAGKSTLLHILGTLESPSQGKVLFGPDGADLTRMNEKSLARFRNTALGFVFQFHYLLPDFTALENAMMPILIGGISKRIAEKQAKELLEFVGLGHRLQHRPYELSGGEQQRVAIARAVIARPKLLLADEPTGNLDSANSEKILDLLIELNRTTGVAILMVTHNSQIAAEMTRGIQMRDGRLV